MYRILYWVFVFGLLIDHDGFAQVKKGINLEMVLELGGAKNLTIQNYINEQELALAEVSKAGEWWVPEIQFGFKNHNLFGNAMNADGRFFENVERSNQWVGAGMDAYWDVYEGLHQKELKQKESEIASLNLKAQKNQKLLEIIKVYYDLAVAQMIHHSNLDMALNLDSIVQQIEIQVKGGIRYESEFLMAKSNYNRLQLAVRESYLYYYKNSKKLTCLLNEKEQVQFVVVNDYLLPLSFDLQDVISKISSNKEFTTNLNQMMGEGKNSSFEDQSTVKRPEIEIEERKLELLEMKYDFLRKEFMIPKIRLNTYGSMFGDVYSSFNSTSALNLGLTWRVPLARIFMRGEYGILSKQMLILENEKEIISDKYSKEQMVFTVKVNSCREAVFFAKESFELAQKAFDQSLQRQKLGLAKAFEVFEAEELLLKAKIDYYRIIGEYNKAQYELKVASGVEL